MWKHENIGWRFLPVQPSCHVPSALFPFCLPNIVPLLASLTSMRCSSFSSVFLFTLSFPLLCYLSFFISSTSGTREIMLLQLRYHRLFAVLSFGVAFFLLLYTCHLYCEFSSARMVHCDNLHPSRRIYHPHSSRMSCVHCFESYHSLRPGTICKGARREKKRTERQGGKISQCLICS